MIEILEATETQKDKFRVTANKLLNKCFIVKRKEDTKKDYYFIKENEDDFRKFFSLLGYQLLVNNEYGVIGLDNIYKTGRVNLPKVKSIILLILRRMYIEKRKELSTVADEVIVKMGEINDAYNSLQIKSMPHLDKKTEKEFVSLFKKYNLITNLDQNVNLADCRILIYPSILMAVKIDDIESYYTSIVENINKYRSTEDEVEESTEDEDIDQD